MFVSRVKAKGQIYFYAYVYDNSTSSGLKTVYSLGKREKAIDQLRSWKNDYSKIPPELIELGLKRENVVEWKRKIMKISSN